MPCVVGRTRATRTAGWPVDRLAHGPPPPHVRGERGGEPGGSVRGYGPCRRAQAQRSGLPLDPFASPRGPRPASLSLWSAQRTPRPRHPTRAAPRIPECHQAPLPTPRRAVGPSHGRSACPARRRRQRQPRATRMIPARRSQAGCRTPRRARAQPAPAVVPSEAPGVRKRTEHPARRWTPGREVTPFRRAGRIGSNRGYRAGAAPMVDQVFGGWPRMGRGG